ncbi:MAG: hypothetical protein IJ282_04765 [Lachnospiraceae bacterium]|nr:hypothetical protein [Lachnospiraceae bacterium]
MLNEERIILMTKLASYEAHEGKKNGAIGSYFRSDYVGIKVLGSMVCAAIVFAVCFALYIFYDFEVFMQDIYKMDLFLFAQNVLIAFLVFVAGYGLLSYVIYTVRYSKAKKAQKNYYNNLKKLASMYEKSS